MFIMQTIINTIVEWRLVPQPVRKTPTYCNEPLSSVTQKGMFYREQTTRVEKCHSRADWTD